MSYPRRENSWPNQKSHRRSYLGWQDR